jgi:hypothetical protein
MKKIVFSLLYIPLFLCGQNLSPFSSSDVVVNQIIKNTIPFIKDLNTPKPNFRFYITKEESLINWSDKRFYKWEILDKKVKLKD